MNRYFAIGTVALLLGVGFYALFVKENTAAYSFPILKKARETELVRNLKDRWETIADSSVKTEPQKAIQSGAENLLEKAKDGIAATAEKVNEAVASAIDNIKIGALRTVKGTVDKQVDDLGEKLGVEVGSVDSRQDSPVVFGVKSGAAAYFTIHNQEAGAINYKVDWRDGSEDAGRLQEGKSAVLSHRWEKFGTYLLKFTTTYQGKESNYQISITVL